MTGDRSAQPPNKLDEYRDRLVSDLVTLTDPLPGEAEQERHHIYSLMLMALVHEYWNGNKYGRSGTYDHNEPNPTSGPHLDEDYKGHNIAAIAVDRFGAVIDFDFNHNRLFNSSAEHAEARLVRRVFAMSQLADTWRPMVGSATPEHVALDDYSLLSDVTVYTSLESCAQCSGIMALGRVRQVVYLQTDPGMYYIGRILRNLTDDKLRAPLPIEGRDIGLAYFDRLDAAARAFPEQLTGKPFWAGTRDATYAEERGPSLTSFLCTKTARDIYGEARAEFTALSVDSLRFPTHKPEDRKGVRIKDAKSNADAIGEARDFFRYATTSGRRGTPHH